MMHFLPLRGQEAGGRPQRVESLGGWNSVTLWTRASEANFDLSPKLSHCVSESLSRHHEKSTECLQGGGEIWVLQ